MHREGANLDFEYLVFRPHYGGMQRLIAVLFRVGDIVVKLIRHVVPARVNNPQHGVAVRHFRHQNTHRTHVMNLRKIDPFALHFAPDRVDMLGTPIHVVAVDMLGFHQAFDGFDHIMDIAVAVKTLLRQQLGNRLVVVFMQVTKREVFQLPLKLPNAEAMGQRRVNIGDFPGNL